MTERTPLIAGNWKMNLDRASAINLVKGIASEIETVSNVDVLVAPPFPYLQTVKEAIGNSGILLAAQNMHWEEKGAFTGEVSGGMLIEAGCSHVILGHSERRSLFGDTNKGVDLKAKAATAVGLIPIICVGETLGERETGNTFEVIRNQLEGSLKNYRKDKQLPESTVLAYEPVWAIGTGKTATPEQAQEVHAFIRQWITESFDQETAGRTRILYGGSVKGENVTELMSKPDIDGALVGGASLKPESFIPIIRF